MGLLFENGDIEILEPVLEEKSEYRLETELYLPDYLPDIQKLLRWEIIPRVQSRDMLAGRINIEGEAEIRVFYKGADEEKISCISVLKEFTHTVAVSEPDAVYDVSTKTTACINSARASGARKITVKAEVITCIVAAENKTLQIIEKASDEIEVRYETVTAISSSYSEEREVRITEELELPESAHPISTLLYTDTVIKTVDVSVLKGKAVIKGEVSIKPVYLSDAGNGIQCAEFSFPVSQIIDIEGIGEEDVCDGSLEIASVYAEPDASADGKCKKIDCEVVINAIIHVYKIARYSLITDAFSPKNEISTERIDIKHLTCYDFYRDSKTVRGQIECENSVASIIDVSGTPKIIRVYRAENCMNIEGVILSEIIYKSEEGMISAKRGEIQFQFSFPYNCDYDIRCDAQASVVALNYMITAGNTVDIRCETLIKAAVCAERESRVLSDISIVGTKEECLNCPITLYFAEKGESVWDIAKRYGASVNEIRFENDIQNDIIAEETMLIIPVK